MSQRDSEDRPQHNVSNVSYEVVDTDKDSTPFTGAYAPRNWPDYVRVLSSSPKG